MTSVRYPSSLSHGTSGPSRPSRPSRYEQDSSSSSIDDEVPILVQTVNPPQNGFSSLADMLQMAGYKETRVLTPEAEKVRSRIKKTFEEDDADEINSLYGVYGFQPRNPSALGLNRQNQKIAHEHRIQHITEPTIPVKSSSSILRSLALQDVTALQNDLSRATSPTMNEGWWEGGLAALGLAKKGLPEKVVISDSAPPASYGTRQVSGGVGLGLANSGQGVRKVKSTWELETSYTKDPHTAVKKIPSSVKQENRPPVARAYSAPSRPEDKPTRYPGFGNKYNQHPPSTIASIFNSPPPPAFDEDAFGYCPLPEDYEAQADEDEALYGLDYTAEVYSLGSDSSGRSRESSEDRDRVEMRGIDASLDEIMASSSLSLGKGAFNILEGAVDYSDLPDSPPAKSSTIPYLEERPRNQRSTTLPQPEPSPPQIKVLKYGDRATRLRIAKSTPHLNQSKPTSKPSWLGSLRTAFIGGPQNGYQSIPTEIEPVSQVRGPFRLSPIVPAAPTLITTSPVICDSASTEAEDLPPIHSPTMISPTMSGISSAFGTMSTAALRLRPSIQLLRDAVGMPAKTVRQEDSQSPMLSPRLDWGGQSEQLDLNEEIRGELGIDYSKSFFYKPATPPRSREPSDGSNSICSSSIISETSSSSAASIDQSLPVARRQRSIKSLRAALLIPTAPVPPLPITPRTPPLQSTLSAMVPPVLAIQSPGTWEAGLPPRELVLEGEEWDAREGGIPGDWGSRGKVKKSKSKSNGLRKQRSKEEL